MMGDPDNDRGAELAAKLLMPAKRFCKICGGEIWCSTRNGELWVHSRTSDVLVAHDAEPMPVATLPECKLPPAGWRCTRGSGHEGPCAAVPIPSFPGFYRAIGGDWRPCMILDDGRTDGYVTIIVQGQPLEEPIDGVADKDPNLAPGISISNIGTNDGAGALFGIPTTRDEGQNSCMEFRPTRWQRFILWLFPSHYVELPDWKAKTGKPDKHGDVIHSEIETRLDWKDRLRVLISGRCKTTIKIVTENPLGDNVTAGGFTALPAKWMRGIE